VSDKKGHSVRYRVSASINSFAISTRVQVPQIKLATVTIFYAR